MPQRALAIRWIAWGVIVLGTALRLHDFLLFRSLWLDEVMLARNIIDRSAAELLFPLDYDQAAPIGFLLMQRALVTLLGSREWVFRLLPLVSGILSLLLFARLTRRFVEPYAGVFCLILFALTPTLAMSSGKQYGVDVLVTLTVLSLAIWICDRGHRACDYALLSIAGAILVWVSQPAALVLAAAGGTLLATHLWHRRWLRVTVAIAAIAVWLASFAWMYFGYVRPLHSNEYLQACWSQGFPPINGNSLVVLQWMGTAVVDSLRLPGQLKPVELALVLVTIGGTSLLIRSPQRFGLLALPITITLAVSLARFFPFQGRLLLFLLPFYFWLIGIGIEQLLAVEVRAVRIAAVGCLLLLIVRPCGDARKLALRPPRWEEPRAVVAHIAAHARRGDVVYVHPNSTHAWAFYKRFHDFGGVDVVHGVLADPLTAKLQLADIPDGQRVWVLHLDLNNAACPIRPITKEQLFATLAGRRAQIDAIARAGASAALFAPATNADATAYRAGEGAVLAR
jgi:hypothetical protein